MNTQIRKIVNVFLLLIVGIFITACRTVNQPIQAIETIHYKSEVTTHASRGDVEVVEGAVSEIVTGPGGATLNINTTDLNPGHIYTVWFVAFNSPEACEGSPCTGKDLLGNTDAVGGESGYATGVIADDNGNANFFAHMPLGDVPNAWFDNGFTNPYAEIHLVLMDAGPAIEGMEDEMLGSLRGGCTDESVPGAYPDTAKADGFTGPNTCQLYQVSIFVPDVQLNADSSVASR